MAFEVNLIGRVVDKNNSALAGLPVTLNKVLQTDNIRGTKTYQSISTINTDGSGYVLFSGVSAATYDAFVSHPSGTFSLQNIQVKNEYPIAIGGTEAIVEQRTYIRSQETIGPSGIMIELEPTPIWLRIGPLGSDARTISGVNAGYVTNVWEDRLDGVLYSGTLALSKELGVRYYYTNQDTYQSQKFVIKILY